jgi:hypothetical protein
VNKIQIFGIVNEIKEGRTPYLDTTVSCQQLNHFADSHEIWYRHFSQKELREPEFLKYWLSDSHG